MNAPDTGTAVMESVVLLHTLIALMAVLKKVNKKLAFMAYHMLMALQIAIAQAVLSSKKRDA